MRPDEIPELTDPEYGLVRSAHEPTLGRASLMTGWRTVEGGPAVLDVLFSPEHDPARVTLVEDTPGAGAPAQASGRDTGPGGSGRARSGPAANGGRGHFRTC